MFGVFGPRAILCFASQEEPEPMDLIQHWPTNLFSAITFLFLIYIYLSGGREGKKEEEKEEDYKKVIFNS